MEVILKEISEFVKKYSISNLQNTENLLGSLNVALRNKFKIKIKYDLKKYYSGSDVSFVTSCDRREQESYIYSGYVFVLSTLTPISPINVKLLNFPVANPFALQFTPRINDLLAEGYKVYPMLDGIKVSMYYNKNTMEWNYATKNSVDIKNTEWRDYVYRSLFEEAEIENTVVSKFNKDYIYNCIFYNNKIHYMKYNEKSTSITVLNIYDLTGKPVLEDEWQKPLDITYPDMLEQYSNTKQEIEKFLDGKLKELTEAKNFVGYILRHQDREKDVYSLPSILYDHVRKLLYDGSEVTSKTKFSSTNYMLLVNYLNLSRKNKFIKLFPNKVYQFDSITQLISKITNKIYYKFVVIDPDYNKLASDTKHPLVEKIENFNQSCDEQIEILANFLYKSIKSYTSMKFVPDDTSIEMNRDIIWNMVADINNITHIYECI